ncbi:hypothetical protein ACQQ65_09250, partial [Corynebacterium diphtheriae]
RTPKEYDKLSTKPKKKHAAKQSSKKKSVRSRSRRQGTPRTRKSPAPAPAPQAQAPVVQQESGSSDGDFIAGILAIVTGALTPMSIGTAANAFLKNNGLPHF